MPSGRQATGLSIAFISLCFVSADQQYLHDTALAAIAQYANYPHCHVPIQIGH